MRERTHRGLRARSIVSALIVVIVAVLSSVSQAGAASATTTQGGICGTTEATRPHYKHVIWIWMENEPYDSIVGSSEAPYINSLAGACGLATNSHNITHPSAPNYIAAVTGETSAGADDCTPSQCPDQEDNLFAQITRSGETWRAYAEGMTANCDQGPLADGWAPPYDVNHNPPVYFPKLAADCAKYDQPMGTPTSGNFADALANGLPSFTFIAPGVCNDMHSCPISTGDAYLKELTTAIVNGKDYRSGDTAVFLTWDEGEGGSTNDCAYNTTDQGCHTTTIVISPSTRPGTRSAVLYNHYSLLKTTEQVLRLHGGYLGHAADSTVNSMARAFRV